MVWGFYGRQDELSQLKAILSRGRFAFVKLTGRRRIGKTSLIQHALEGTDRPVYYVQIPDSSPAGVVQAARDAMQPFGLADKFAAPNSLAEFASFVGKMLRAGYVVALDEFQYFHRQQLRDFTSFLQAEVDLLAHDAGNVKGVLFVLGSLHTELTAILEDKTAPLFNRTTDEIAVDHWDISALVELLEAQEVLSPEKLLFLWNLFEGIPKFYRDCYEQGVLAKSRTELLRRMFFESSSPLRHEADNWFLKELRGRYDAVLKYIAEHAGCSHADLVEGIRSASGADDHQVGGYLKILTERYRIVEKKLPIFAEPKARAGRYYIRDNFLRSWLGALKTQTSAVHFAPIDGLLATADLQLQNLEGKSFERLVATLYEELSRKGLGSFPLTSHVDGYWDRNDCEIDLVAVNDKENVIRFVCCKRSEAKLREGAEKLRAHVSRFLVAKPHFQNMKQELVVVAPTVSAGVAEPLESAGLIVEDLPRLWASLKPA
jgi:AAA+ ATPase superfamily predicted ATPase